MTTALKVVNAKEGNTYLHTSPSILISLKERKKKGNEIYFFTTWSVKMQLFQEGIYAQRHKKLQKKSSLGQATAAKHTK